VAGEKLIGTPYELFPQPGPPVIALAPFLIKHWMCFPFLELHLGRKGATMNIGMGGADVSLGTVAQSLAGLDAWRVNAELWTSKEAEAHKYTSSLRTLYSVGGAKELALYKEILSGMTNVEENAQGAYSAKTEAHGDGTKTISICRDALADGSRFGMNILLAHESYRNGVNDGEAGQRKETDQAVLGHINTALALGQIYGMNSLSSLQANEVNTYVAAIKSGQYGELAKILNSYESSADYWRVLKDGNIVFDGKKDLYDENGRLLRKYEGSGDGGWTASLAEHLGLSDGKIANALMVNAGFDHLTNGTFVDKNGVDVTLNADFAIQTSGKFKASYDFQINYADKVLTKYGGNMEDAVSAYQADIQQKIELGRLSGNIDQTAMSGYEMIQGLKEFAKKYNATLYGERYGSFGFPGLVNRIAADVYDEKKVLSGLNVVAKNQLRSDNHPMYKKILDGTFTPLLGPDGSVGPTVGINRYSEDPIYITTRTRYEDGKEHGWYRDGAFAMSVDLGTDNKPLGVIAFSASTILTQGDPFGWNNDSGGYAQLDLGPLDLRYVHLSNSWELQRSMSLQQAAAASPLYRYNLPAGYSFGPLYNGSLPLSTGTHLHMEFIWR